jgi:hypothetical protein
MNRKQFQDQVDPAPAVRHLRSEVRALEHQIATAKTSSGQISEALNRVREEVQAIKPAPMIYHPPAGKPAVSSAITHVIQVTDWHIGQVTAPEHVEEFGEFSFHVAEQRVRKLLKSTVDSTGVNRNGYRIDKCVVLGTADWISGDIHDELIRTNEFPAPVQAVKSGFLLGEFLAGLAPHFKEVEVHLLTAGNHDRITRKPQCEDGGLNSWGYVTTVIAQQRVRALPNVRVKIHTALSAIVEVSNTRYLITHGDGIRGTWGIPFYGIERRKQKEAMARMNMEEGRHFDKIVIGHFHAALNHEHWLIGGSLTGTTAYDHKEGRHSKPHQTSWLLHPKYKEFNWNRWWL